MMKYQLYFVTGMDLCNSAVLIMKPVHLGIEHRERSPHIDGNIRSL